jgi:hypothetical protein
MIRRGESSGGRLALVLSIAGSGRIMPNMKHESRFDPAGLPIYRGFCYTLHREAKSALTEN